MHDAADHAAIVRSLNTSDIGRQMSFDPRPLLIAQPKQVLAHAPDSHPNHVRMESRLHSRSSKINEF
jgi:hypothetical protein